ncbi:DMT family transporter [Bradyrhizobium sp.]|uniref:DMT family transporter n=1 Tax=Bradyrhizobium sp. TaxID=376 RepID=UPI0025B85079|nr:DMT family transporter [Bradyrhizobium sp.]
MQLKSGKVREVLGLLGFLVLATAQVSNMILARGVAGSVPPFSIAFFRWSIVAVGLSPLIVAALRQQPGILRKEGLGIAAAGFLGMFVCGGPVYLAGTTTSAINLALIMAMAPLMVLLFSLVMGLEKVNRWQIIGMIIALSGAVLVITRGQTSGEHGLTQGDILVVFAMLGWAGYTLVQNRIGAGVSFLARIGMFAAAGALFSLPFAIHEMWSDPSAVLSLKAAEVYLFAGLVPGLFAYSAYSYFGSAFGALSTSLSMYLGPVVGAVLSIIFLGEAPTIVHLIGGALSLGGMWLSLRRKSGGGAAA